MAAEAAKESLTPSLKKRPAEDPAPSRLSPSKKMRMKVKKVVSLSPDKKTPQETVVTSGSPSPISLGSQSPRSPPRVSPRKVVSLSGETTPLAQYASSSQQLSRSPSHEGAPSRYPALSAHFNFNMGPTIPDVANDPTLIWDKGAHRVSIYTLLPSWREKDQPTGHAFSLGFGLYGGHGPDPLDKASSRDLVLRATQS
ncbi:hypothetical protein KSP39_PZI004063 [Platanthera zijinensis]|uniref:Uncharacterized protein n=1 Tax=Platanthera zijinensis TaxID=2320716 RepID=A0AAP0BTZ3_9ASPA